MKQYARHIPEGLKDFLGEEAALKDYIEYEMKHFFYKHHYALIETPMFEFLDVWASGNTQVQDTGLYNWVNRQGEIVALRSDMTKSIARVVATQQSTKPFPQRYTYAANVFRYPKSYQGKQHEFTQVGIELLGRTSCESDTEVLVLAIEAIKKAGVRDFIIHIGSATFLSEVLKMLGASEAQEKRIYSAISSKDAVSLKRILGQLDDTGEVRETLVNLMQRSGGIELVREVKNKFASTVVRQSLAYLEEIYERLVMFDVEDYVLFDFSILSYASYYTGIMFQGFTEGIGVAIVEGGRYDHLLEQFGKAIPAVGMAINVNHILQKVQMTEPVHRIHQTVVTWDKEVAQQAIDFTKKCREQGKVMAYSIEQGINQTLITAKKQGMTEVLYFRADSKVEIHQVEKQVCSVIEVTSLGGEMLWHK